MGQMEHQFQWKHDINLKRSFVIQTLEITDFFVYTQITLDLSEMDIDYTTRMNHSTDLRHYKWYLWSINKITKQSKINHNSYELVTPKPK